MKRFAVAITLYALVLLALIGAKPFWLDEVIQLSISLAPDWSSFIAQVKANPGAAPLGWATEYWSIAILGHGFLGARLVSLLCGLGTLCALLRLGRELELRGAVLAAALWMICPLALRYSLEGRSYMQGVLFATLAALAQIRFGKTGKIVWAAALAACLSAAVYSQTYAVLAPVGFSLACVWRESRRVRALTAAAYAAAALSFLPWFLAVRAQWAVNAVASSPGGFDLGAALRVLTRELLGDGYLASIPALLLIARRRKPLLLAALISGVVLALAGDALYRYFFAIRQVIPILPFLILLVADSACDLWTRSRPAAALALALLAGASLVKDVRHFTDHNEDWRRLSNVLAGSAGRGCIWLPPSRYPDLYEIFRPDIRQRLCTSALAPRAVTPVHQYIQGKPSLPGMTKVETIPVGFASVEVYEKR